MTPREIVRKGDSHQVSLARTEARRITHLADRLQKRVWALQQRIQRSKQPGATSTPVSTPVTSQVTSPVTGNHRWELPPDATPVKEADQTLRDARISPSKAGEVRKRLSMLATKASIVGSVLLEDARDGPPLRHSLPRSRRWSGHPQDCLHLIRGDIPQGADSDGLPQNPRGMAQDQHAADSATPLPVRLALVAVPERDDVPCSVLPRGPVWPPSDVELF